MSADRSRVVGDAAAIVSLGEALAVGVPPESVTLDQARTVDLYVGGAEVNFVVGLRRLGFASRFVGRVGEDSLGTMIVDELAHEGVDVSTVLRDARPTGLYLREWLADGGRRPYYYRQGSAGSGLTAADGESAIVGASWLHLTGITPALGRGPVEAVRAACEGALRTGIPVSYDANYRSALWPPEDFVDFTRSLLPMLDVLLIGEDEAELLFGSADPGRVLAATGALEVGRTVLRLGARGAVALDESGELVAERCPASPLDPVGAGDAFDAGFIAALRCGALVRGCLRLGVYCGARVVEHVGEHVGAPRRADLPTELRVLVDRADGGRTGAQSAMSSNGAGGANDEVR